MSGCTQTTGLSMISYTLTRRGERSFARTSRAMSDTRSMPGSSSSLRGSTMSTAVPSSFIRVRASETVARLSIEPNFSAMSSRTRMTRRSFMQGLRAVVKRRSLR